MKHQKDTLGPLGLALTGFLQDISKENPGVLPASEVNDLTSRMKKAIQDWPDNPDVHTQTLLGIVRELKDIGAPASALGRANPEHAKGVGYGAVMLEDDLIDYQGGQGSTGDSGGGSAPTPRPRPSNPAPVYSQTSSQGGYQPESEKKGLYS